MNAPVKSPTIGDNTRPLITPDQLAIDFAHVEKFVAELEAKAKEAPPALEDDDDLAIINALVPKLRAGAKRCDEVRDENKRPYLDACNTVQTFFKALENRLTSLKLILEARGTRYLQKKADAELARQAELERQQREEAAKREREAIEAAKAGKPEEAKAAMTAATQAQDRADDAATAVAAKPADLARTHTSAGTATLVEHWEARCEDVQRIDLKLIQTFIRRDEIMAALNAFARANKDAINAGTVKIEGVTFVPAHKASFRS